MYLSAETHSMEQKDFRKDNNLAPYRGIHWSGDTLVLKAQSFMLFNVAGVQCRPALLCEKYISSHLIVWGCLKTHTSEVYGC